MREIKFRAWTGKEIHDDFLLSSTGDIYLEKYCEYGEPMQLMPEWKLIQYTGLKDKNGVEIYDGDLLNIFYTSENGEHIHDCIYQAKIKETGLEFEFESLLWQSHGFNQYPISCTLSERFNSLASYYNVEKDSHMLCVPDSYGRNHRDPRNKWKQNDKSFYFEVIGNIYENPELIEQELEDNDDN